MVLPPERDQRDGARQFPNGLPGVVFRNSDIQTTEGFNMAGVALFGGTFDPIHVGHLIAAEGVKDALKLNRVVFVPAGTPPHKLSRSLAPTGCRLEMVRLAVQDNPYFEVWDFETRREGPAYTIDTVRAWKSAHPEETRPRFIIGEDTIPELSTWRDIGALVEESEIVPVARPGSEEALPQELRERIGKVEADGLRERMIRVPLVDVSSTEIRERLAAGRSVRYLIPEPVHRYIRENHLYRDVTRTPGDKQCLKTIGPA